MNNLAKVIFAASAVAAFSASAQGNVQAKTGSGAYLQDSRGVVTRSGPGLCWHTGIWTPADALAGCDAELVKPAPVVAAPEPAPPPPPPPAPAPVSEKVTLAADTAFDFDKAVLKPEGKSKLDDLAAKLQDMNLEVVIAVGHTDRVGNDAYNQKLSMRRAEAVKGYLVSKGIDSSRVYTEGKGSRQPIADNKTAAGRAKNRRVEIEVVGTRTKVAP